MSMPWTFTSCNVAARRFKFTYFSAGLLTIQIVGSVMDYELDKMDQPAKRSESQDMSALYVEIRPTPIPLQSSLDRTGKRGKFKLAVPKMSNRKTPHRMRTLLEHTEISMMNLSTLRTKKVQSRGVARRPGQT